MTRESLSVLAGLAVMAAGMIVFFGAQAGSGTVPETPVEVRVEEWPPPTSATSATPSTPEIPGVSAAIANVLIDAGDAEELGTGDLTDLDPAVARVLVAFGATLRVPVEADQAG